MILTVKRRALKSEAIQFTKGFGADAKAQLLEREEVAAVKNGGAYLFVQLSDEFEGEEPIKMLSGWVMVFDKVEGPLVYSEEMFAQLYLTQAE